MEDDEFQLSECCHAPIIREYAQNHLDNPDVMLNYDQSWTECTECRFPCNILEMID